MQRNNNNKKIKNPGDGFTNAVHPIYVNDSSTGPHMGDAWEPFLFRGADPGRVFFFFFFSRGNSSCLAALVQSAWLYLHSCSNKEACTNNRKGSRLHVTELKQATVGHVFQTPNNPFEGWA